MKPGNGLAQPEHALISVAAAFIYGYGKEPGFQTTLAAESFQAEIRSQKDVLRDILDFARPAEQSVRQHRDFSGVLLDDSFKDRFVALIEFLDERLVIVNLGHDHNIRLDRSIKLTKKSLPSRIPILWDPGDVKTILNIGCQRGGIEPFKQG